VLQNEIRKTSSPGSISFYAKTMQWLGPGHGAVVVRSARSSCMPFNVVWKYLSF